MNSGDHKIYYKGSQYKHQDYIPTCAQKNRREKHYLVQFPQGINYFSGSRKKQYSYLHNQSQIQKINLFYQQPSNYNHSNLQISDIQGTNTNSLISQAIKNRMRGNYWYNSRVKEGKNHVRCLSTPRNNLNQNDILVLKQPAFDKNYLCYNEYKDNGVNYHLKHKKYHTEPVQNIDQIKNTNSLKSVNGQNQLEQQIVQYQYNPQINKMPESTQTQPYSRIKDLQQQLFRKQQNRLKPNNSSTSNYKSIISITKDNDINSRIKDGQNNNQFTHNNYHLVKNQSFVDGGEMEECQNQKIKLFPTQEIRKLNPTYLSTDNNYIPTENISKWKQYLAKYKS